MFYERYINLETHGEHAKKPYEGDFYKKSENLLEKPIEISHFTRIII